MDFTKILPKEMIEEILSYVPAKKSLFLVNKKINEIIGDSEKLMRKFEICWFNETTQDIDVLINSRRKYSSIMINYRYSAKSSMEIIIPLLERLPIKHLDMRNFHFTSSQFHEILSAVSKTLVEIELMEINVSDPNQMRDFRRLEFKKLTHLELMFNQTRIYELLLPFLSARKLETIKIDSNRETELTKDEMINWFQFLNGQQNLKKLYIERYLSEVFMKKEYADALVLQLEKLSVEAVDSVEFYNFLRKQVSLKKFKICNWFISHNVMQLFLNEMKALKCLHLTNIGFDVIDSLWTLKINPNIEEISFTYNENFIDDRFIQTISTIFNLRLLPNLRVISFLGFTENLLNDIMLAIQATAEKLEVLQFQECWIPCLKFETLKLAKFVACDAENVEEFLMVNDHTDNNLEDMEDMN